ncbi:MAG: transketolase family protein [Elusimicrobiota bacterium]
MSEKKAIRDGFGEGLVELGKENNKIVVLSGDLEDATKAILFKEEFPERFLQIGISEQDLVGTAVGFSKEGFIPFAVSFAVFLTNRAYDQIRVSVCYNESNVKLIGSHAGLTVGPDGATAQCLEDLAIMRVLPNMTVICPCDAVEASKAVKVIAEHNGPVYMRLGRPSSAIITKDDTPFVIGKANMLCDGNDVTIISCGLILNECLSAVEMLKGKGINARVINMHTIKPIDKEIIIKCADETGAIVTVEEHQANGGLGSAVCEALSGYKGVPVEMIAVKDSFGESGQPDELLIKYKLKDVDIVNAVSTVLLKKK